jgi:hypothetical protein
MDVTAPKSSATPLPRDEASGLDDRRTRPPIPKLVVVVKWYDAAIELKPCPIV